MAKSERSIKDKAMGDKPSRSRYSSNSMDFDTEYDSTWEDECDQEVQSSETRSSNSSAVYSSSGYSSSGYSSSSNSSSGYSGSGYSGSGYSGSGYSSSSNSSSGYSSSGYSGSGYSSSGYSGSGYSNSDYSGSGYSSSGYSGSGYSNSDYSGSSYFSYSHAARDMQNFRHTFRDVQFDGKANDEKLKQIYFEEKHFLPNLWFYQNKMVSKPGGVYIDEFHSEWFGDYERLEWVHSYIQWLFPIQEPGMNSDAYVLTHEEIKLFRKDEEAKERLLKSYKLMLDFYGIELRDEETGEVCRAVNWEERFRNLNRNTHNNLRITRILKCLGILGFEHYQAPLVRFFLEETLVNGKLPNVKRSVLNYFMFAVLDRSKRKELIRYAFENFKTDEDFVWCPLRIQRRFETISRKSDTPDTHPSENPAVKVDANGNSANSITDHKNEPETKTTLGPSDVTAGNENASDSNKVNEGPPDQMRGSNTSQDAFGDSGKTSPIQKGDCDDNALEVSPVKNETEVHKHTEQSRQAPVSVSSDVANQESVSDGNNKNESGNENVSGGADTQEKHRECSITSNDAMCEVSNEQDSARRSTEKEEPGMFNTGNSGKMSPAIQNSGSEDNMDVDTDTPKTEHAATEESAVMTGSEGCKDTEHTGQISVSGSATCDVDMSNVQATNMRNEEADEDGMKKMETAEKINTGDEGSEKPAALSQCGNNTSAQHNVDSEKGSAVQSSDINTSTPMAVDP